MPTYDYVCQNAECRDEWESVESIVADPDTYCPTCGKRTAARVISQSFHDGFMLKGGGWSGGRGTSAAIRMHNKADSMPLSKGGRSD